MNEQKDLQTEEVFHPYVSAKERLKEFTLVPILIGALLGVIFGASSLYLVLKVGMTISASIPIAVISITLFRFFSQTLKMRQATILENNIVQTTGSAGESIAFGVGVTMPALMILGYDMEVSRVMTISCLGGLLGILMMIPLRRGLIVKQHKVLTYPEGTACAEILIAGEEGGTNAKTVFTGFGIGFLYKMCVEGLKLWPSTPSKVLSWFQGVKVSGEFSPELLGVGYIIGPRTASIMMAGGVLSTLVLIPLIKLFGDHLTTPLYPGTTLISAMETHEIWKSYILYIGAGAVAMGGIIGLIRSFPLIYSSFKAGIGDFHIHETQKNKNSHQEKGETKKFGLLPRTEQDLPLYFVLIGSLLLVIAIWLTPVLNVNLLGAVLIILFGFLFVTVSSRLTGEIGSSSNPISGMTVSTLLLTCLIFLGLGWTGADYRLSALSIAAVVCVAAAVAGATSQDLKTGYLVGSTPKYQQISILVGALVSAIFIGKTLLLLNEASTVYSRPNSTISLKIDLSKISEKETLRGEDYKYDRNEYYVLHLNAPQGELQAGKYLLNELGEVAYIVDPGINGVIKHRDSNYRYLPPPLNHNYKVDMNKLATFARERLRGPESLRDSGEYFVLLLHEGKAGLTAGRYLVSADGLIKYKVDPGPEVIKYDSPKAKLMSLIIDGILTQKLPWALVLVGACIAILLELCQVSSLPFAVGVYLPFSASAPIFLGGAVRWLIEQFEVKRPSKKVFKKESSPGILFSSGLIAGGSIAGIFLAILAAKEWDENLNLGRYLGSISESHFLSFIIFCMLGGYLFCVARGWTQKK